MALTICKAFVCCWNVFIFSSIVVFSSRNFNLECPFTASIVSSARRASSTTISPQACRNDCKSLRREVMYVCPSRIIMSSFSAMVCFNFSNSCCIFPFCSIHPSRRASSSSSNTDRLTWALSRHLDPTSLFMSTSRFR